MASNADRSEGIAEWGRSAENMMADYHSKIAESCQGYEGNFEMDTEATEKTEITKTTRALRTWV